MKHITPEYIAENHVIMTRSEWRKAKKANLWKKLFRKAPDKWQVIDCFCASFSNSLDEITNTANDPVPFVLEGQTLARGMARTCDYHDGWKLHDDWFKCMLAQLVLASASLDTSTNGRAAYDGCKRLFNALEWSFEDSLNPKYDSLTTIEGVEYEIEKVGVRSLQKYRVLLEPTTPIPAGSRWLSSSGKIWEAQLPDGKYIDMEPEDTDINGNPVEYKLLKLTPEQIYGMNRL